VHIEEVLEKSARTHQIPDCCLGFTPPDPEEMSQEDQLFVCFISRQSGRSQSHSDHLSEAHGGSRGDTFNRLKDIVAKPYQEFKDVFSQGIL